MNREENSTCANPCRVAFSLLEVTAVIVLLGAVSLLALVRLSSHSLGTKKHACDVYRRNIEMQCQLWIRQQGSAPAANLADIGSDLEYFPDGLPVCPVDQSPYTILPATGRVIGHLH